jgi:hypothetical protein
MGAGDTSSNARGRGTARKVVTGRTLPKDSTTAPYKMSKNPIGRPRSKARAQSLEILTRQEKHTKEDWEMEEIEENRQPQEPKIKEDTSNSPSTIGNQDLTRNPDKRREEEEDTEKTDNNRDGNQDKKEGKEGENDELRDPNTTTSREIMRKIRYRTEIKPLEN